MQHCRESSAGWKQARVLYMPSDGIEEDSRSGTPPMGCSIPCRIRGGTGDPWRQKDKMNGDPPFVPLCSGPGSAPSLCPMPSPIRGLANSRRANGRTGGRRTGMWPCARSSRVTGRLCYIGMCRPERLYFTTNWLIQRLPTAPIPLQPSQTTRTRRPVPPYTPRVSSHLDISHAATLHAQR